MQDLYLAYQIEEMLYWHTFGWAHATSISPHSLRFRRGQGCDRQRETAAGPGAISNLTNCRSLKAKSSLETPRLTRPCSGTADVGWLAVPRPAATAGSPDRPAT